MYGEGGNSFVRMWTTCNARVFLRGLRNNEQDVPYIVCLLLEYTHYIPSKWIYYLASYIHVMDSFSKDFTIYFLVHNAYYLTKSDLPECAHHIKKKVK